MAMVAGPLALAFKAPWYQDEGELIGALILGLATVLYLAYHLMSSPRSVQWLFPSRALPDALRTTTAFFRKGLGTLLLGVVPAILAALCLPGGLAACGLTFDEAPRSLLMASIFIALSLPAIAVQARKPAFRLHYPEVRAPFTRRLAACNAAAWAAYLGAYELFFRGLLVLALASYIGPLPALAASLMGYVFVHLGHYPGELLGTLLSGSVFGLAVLDTGSILMPWVAHLGLALASDHLASRPLPKEGRVG